MLQFYDRLNELEPTESSNINMLVFQFLIETLSLNPKTKDVFEPSALATEMVGMTGFEPATPSPPDWCATGLRYIPTRSRKKCGGGHLRERDITEGKLVSQVLFQAAKPVLTRRFAARNQHGLGV
jgi:hypothetical protein